MSIKYSLDLYLTRGSETWTPSKTNEPQLSLFESKVLLYIFGSKQRNETWLKGYNYESYEAFNEPNIANYIKVNRLAWAGHMMLMDNDRILNKIFNTKPDGVRRFGRPKLRWGDGTAEDMRALYVKI